MPKGYHKDGTKHVPASGFKATTDKPKVKKGPYWFDADVVAILARQPNATAYIQKLILQDNATNPAT